MEEAFIKQDFTLRLATGEVLTGGTEPEIIFTRPDRVVGIWEAAIDGENIVRDIMATDITLAGLWMFEPTAIVSGKIWKGDIVRMMLKKSLND